MLAPGNYVQWKSRIKRYIDTKPNNEPIQYCLQNPHYKFKWTEKTVHLQKDPSFNTESLQKVQNDNDNYNVFANDSEHPKQPESVNDTYPDEQDEHKIIIDSLDMSHDREQDDQDDDDLAKERDLVSSLIEKLRM
ncbi:hypothetical protein Tco_0767720 [Tanacetum coccineum]